MFSLNSANSVTKVFVIAAKGFKPATSCVRDQDAATVPERHMWETQSLHWAQFMLQWFIAEFTEFNESSAPFRKTQISSRSATISNHEKSCVVFCFVAAVNEAHELLWFNWTWWKTQTFCAETDYVIRRLFPASVFLLRQLSLRFNYRNNQNKLITTHL